jgi:hypothetical protein
LRTCGAWSEPHRWIAVLSAGASPTVSVIGRVGSHGPRSLSSPQHLPTRAAKFTVRATRSAMKPSSAVTCVYTPHSRMIRVICVVNTNVTAHFHVIYKTGDWRCFPARCWKTRGGDMRGKYLRGLRKLGCRARDIPLQTFGGDCAPIDPARRDRGHGPVGRPPCANHQHQRFFYESSTFAR